MHPDVDCSIFHGGQDMETTKVHFDRWLDKKDVVHIYNEISLSCKKRQNTAICNNMDGSWDYHAKWNKSDIKSWEPYDITHMWDIKLKATNKTETHGHRQQFSGY